MSIRERLVYADKNPDCMVVYTLEGDSAPIAEIQKQISNGKFGLVTLRALSLSEVQELAIKLSTFN